jgi:hypothetical protein
MGSVSDHSGVAAMGTLTTKDGKMPIVVGEYGYDPGQLGGGAEVLNAVHKSGLSSAAWAWHPASDDGTDASMVLNDDLTNGNGGLSSYGQQVAQHIASNPVPCNPTASQKSGASRR